jgi:mono/diheme cytochrome c family protein
MAINGDRSKRDRRSSSFIGGSILFAVAMLIFTTLSADAQTPATAKSDTAAGNAEKGKRLYTSYGCYQCHSRQAQGGAAGPRLAPNPIPLAAIVIYVRHPTGAMPPYTSKVVSDAELADIYAFLQTIPQPPAVKSIPLLNQ